VASQELETVLGLLGDASPLQGDDIPTMRAHMEAVSGAAPRPPDVRDEPIDIDGVEAEWTVAPESRDDHAIVYFHGGGYAIGSIASHRGLVTHLARAARCRVLNVGYRLAPESPYPAALDDATRAYQHALASGLDPGKLALAGDSAGGGLTLATLLRLRDEGLPLPAAAVGLSAWTDLTLQAASIRERAARDPMVTEPMLRMMADAYAGEHDLRTPGISPRHAELRGLPPLLLQVGTDEILYDDSADLALRARAAGVDVTFDPWEDMIHVWHAFADLLPEGKQAIDRVGRWLDARWSA